MAETSSIEWTDATWNPVTGCQVVSPGCTNCYAMKLAGTRLQHHPSRAGLTIDTKAGPVWNGQVRFNAEWLDQPLRWKRPRRIFVCAHGDLFADGVEDDWLDQVFAVMALAKQHTFQVLTKRPERMRDYVSAFKAGERHVLGWANDISGQRLVADQLLTEDRIAGGIQPLPNVWLGVSAENEHWAQVRIPLLLATPAAVRFVSIEPLLGPIDMEPYLKAPRDWSNAWLNNYPLTYPKHPLDWVIVGGESGQGARPMHPDWARELRDACEASKVPFFFKQWGEWTPGENVTRTSGVVETRELLGNGSWLINQEDLAATDGHVDDEPDLYRVGKKAAGRRLDGAEHDGMPT